MKTKTKNSSSTITLTAILFVCLIAWSTSSRAQDAVDQIAAEVDQVEVDVATVNGKANQNSTKVVGVESRVTAAEGELANHGTEVSALASGQTTLENRVATLESAPTTDPTIDGRVSTLEADHAVAIPRLDDHGARITALETAVPETPPVWSMYDSSGALIGTWADRLDLGRALITVGSFDIWAQFDVDRVSYLGIVRPVEIRFKNEISGVCVDPFVVADDYSPLMQSSSFFFAGQVHGWLDSQKRPSSTDGHLYAVDTVTPSVYVGKYYRLNVKQDCTDFGDQMVQADVHLLTDQGSLPTFHPPFTVSQ